MRFLIPVLLVVFSLSGAGCARREASKPAAATRVAATQAFERAFGAAPVTDKGSCFAFVIYFPSARHPGKVTPLPFFSFDEASLKRVALQRLMAGMEEKSYAGELLQLFPPHSRLVSLKEQGGSVVAEFGPELKAVAEDPRRAAALKAALELTLGQFKGVSGVSIRAAREPLFPGAQGAAAAADPVLPPSGPRLLGITAMQERTGQPVEEVDALFDRPVEIKELQFRGNDGNLLAGEVYHSMFDMAAVLKPKEPGRLAKGSPVTVRYRVVDKLGRAAQGEVTLPLELRVHQQ
jgi:germination protein M